MSELEYLKGLQHILENGEDVEDRTGVGARSVFGYQMKFDLQEGFPALTTKKLAWKSVVGELLWFLEGSTDERRLAELTYGKPREQLLDKTTIWTANADNQGRELGHYNDDYIKELGPIYGHQWRSFDNMIEGPLGKDQVNECLSLIKKDPDSRRIIINAWNAMTLEHMALPPCHLLIHFRVYNNKLHSLLYQRSADAFLGVPFNIASYALLTHLFARECNLEVGSFTHSIGDFHIYYNHFDQVKEQLTRTPYNFPILKIEDNFKLMPKLNYGFNKDDNEKFILENYNHHPSIKADMAI